MRTNLWFTIVAGALFVAVATVPVAWAPAAAAPTTWTPTKAGASAGRIPAKVSLAVRASVTAGLAKDVDDVKKYAAPIHAGTSTAPR